MHAQAHGTEGGNEVKEIQEAGKHLATVSGILQGTYFAAVSFSDLKSSLLPCLWWVFFGPLCCWALVLTVSLWIMRPDPRLGRWITQTEGKARRQTWVRKRRVLWNASAILFILGLLWMVVAIVYYFFLYTPPPKSPLPVVITPCP